LWCRQKRRLLPVKARIRFRRIRRVARGDWVGQKQAVIAAPANAAADIMTVTGRLRTLPL